MPKNCGNVDFWFYCNKFMVAKQELVLNVINAIYHICMCFSVSICNPNFPAPRYFVTF